MLPCCYSRGETQPSSGSTCVAFVICSFSVIIISDLLFTRAFNYFSRLTIEVDDYLPRQIFRVIYSFKAEIEVIGRGL